MARDVGAHLHDTEAACCDTAIELVLESRRALRIGAAPPQSST
jgi:hypothetical protein